MDTCVSLMNVHRRSSIGKAKKRKKRPALDAPITSRLNDEDRHRRTGAVPSNVAPGPRDSASLESALAPAQSDLAPVSIITSSASRGIHEALRWKSPRKLCRQARPAS